MENPWSAKFVLQIQRTLSVYVKRSEKTHVWFGHAVRVSLYQCSISAVSDRLPPCLPPSVPTGMTDTQLGLPYSW